MSETSMPILFNACADILAAHRRPIRYDALTYMALKSLGISRNDADFNKEKENVREKMLIAGRYGALYTYKPLYCGVLAHWFTTSEQMEMLLDVVHIPGSATAGSVGAMEALMRVEHMEVHNQALIGSELRMEALANGLVLEKHIAFWFDENYPDMYSDADNSGNWRRPCNHDFKLTVGKRTYRIDVTGPDRHGEHGKRGKKRPTDIHLLAEISGSECLWTGVTKGEHFVDRLDPATVFSPVAFLVWLNCHKHGIDYFACVPKPYRTHQP